MTLNPHDTCEAKGCDQPWESIYVGPIFTCAGHRAQAVQGAL